MDRGDDCLWCPWEKTATGLQVRGYGRIYNTYFPFRVSCWSNKKRNSLVDISNGWKPSREENHATIHFGFVSKRKDSTLIELWKFETWRNIFLIANFITLLKIDIFSLQRHLNTYVLYNEISLLNFEYGIMRQNVRISWILIV